MKGKREMKKLVKINSDHRYIIELYSMYSANELRKHFKYLRQYTRQQIAAVKAHLTMGNYPE
jgi:hypothetical protein